jgi:hypothetical protein
MLGHKATGSFLALFGLSAIALISLASNAANGAIYITKQSKVIILSGYSLELTKQDVPQPLRPRLESMLRGVATGLEDMFETKPAFFSERRLNSQLDALQIPRGNVEEAIRMLLKREKYTHLIVADIEMLDVNVGSASASVRVAKLEDGSVTEWEETQERTLRPTPHDQELHALLFDFLKFRAPDAPKRVNILCISPRSVVSDRRETELENILTKPITLQLIDFYHTQKMKDRGYRPLVHDRTYEFYRDDTKTMKCRQAAAGDSDDPVTKVSVSLPDYVIEGDVGVISTQSGLDSIVLKITVRKLPPGDCRETIPIRHDFERTNYERNKKYDLSVRFSEKIVREKYETWSDKFETDSSCK